MKGFNRTQLKLFAIVAMVCDHIAWTFLDFFTPQAQVLHVIGRLTIPIMCFFVAEGFRKTSNRKKYIGRVAGFYLISILPFYALFHELYGYRQNIMLDLLLGLLLLAVLEQKPLHIGYKIICVAVLFAVSISIGGWPVFPGLCILVFYYKREFRARRNWFCGLTVLLVVVVALASWTNQFYHFSQYNWLWYEKAYLLGFVLALPLLKHYNGKKGGSQSGDWFFYLFYPLHLAILAALSAYADTRYIYYVYLGIHVVVIALAVAMFLNVVRSRPSKAQAANLVLMCFALLYMLGFLIEITTTSLDAIRVAIKVEYFGECTLMIALTWFVSEFFQARIPKSVYIVEGVVALLTMWCMLSLEYNQLFYTDMRMDFSGPFPRVDLSYGIGFYLFVLYMGVICVSAIIFGFISLKSRTGIERKRVKFMIIGFFCPWVAILLREIGVTGGYEVTPIGILGVIVCVAFSWIKYGYFDSVQLAGENALNHGNEGIMVIGTNHRVLYFNHIISELFSNVEVNRDAYGMGEFKSIFEGTLKSVEVNGKTYEMRIEPLVESGYAQGYMLWAIDMTAHYSTLKEIQTVAHTDSLTGLNNRSFFQTSLTEHLRLNGTGAMMMLDLDNFKNVNDTLGHDAGDTVLTTLSSVIRAVADTEHLSCRIGGDEFCVFFKGITHEMEITARADRMIQGFRLALAQCGMAGQTSVSIGIAVSGAAVKDAQAGFIRLYRNADKALYLAKNSGKETYRFY